MFYFTSRRVSCAAIFVWSAAVLLSSAPAASAVPIEARLAEIISMNHQIVARTGCGIHCKAVVNDETEGDTTPSPAVAAAEAEPSDAPSGPAAKLADAAEAPKEDDPAPVAANSDSVEKTGCGIHCKAVENGETSDSEATPESQNVGNFPAPQPVVKTGAALGKAKLSPILTWAIAGTAGAAFAMF